MEMKSGHNGTLCDMPSPSFSTRPALTVFSPAGCPCSHMICLSYIDLFRAVEHLACDLRLSGIWRSTIVSTIFPKCRQLESIILTLALLQIGAIIVPLDANVAQEEIENTLSETEVQMILTTNYHDGESPTLFERVEDVAKKCLIRVYRLTTKWDRQVPEVQIVHTRRGHMKESISLSERVFQRKPYNAAFYFVSAVGILRKSHGEMSTAVDYLTKTYRVLVEHDILVRLSTHHAGGLITWMAALRVGGHIILHESSLSGDELAHLQSIYSIGFSALEEEDARHLLNNPRNSSLIHGVQFKSRHHMQVARCIGGSSLSINECGQFLRQTGFKFVDSYSPASACGLACENGRSVPDSEVGIFDIETGARLQRGMLGCVAASAPWGSGGVVMGGMPFWRMVMYDNRVWMVTGDHGIERVDGSVEVLDSGFGFLLFGERRRNMGEKRLSF